MEVSEKKDRITDALNATKAAVEEGIVPGGGTALVYASRSLEAVKDKCENFDQKVRVGWGWCGVGGGSVGVQCGSTAGGLHIHSFHIL